MCRVIVLHASMLSPSTIDEGEQRRRKRNAARRSCDKYRPRIFRWWTEAWGKWTGSRRNFSTRVSKNGRNMEMHITCSAKRNTWLVINWQEISIDCTCTRIHASTWYMVISRLKRFYCQRKNNTESRLSQKFLRATLSQVKTVCFHSSRCIWYRHCYSNDSTKVERCECTSVLSSCTLPWFFAIAFWRLQPSVLCRVLSNGYQT